MNIRRWFRWRRKEHGSPLFVIEEVAYNGAPIFSRDAVIIVDHAHTSQTEEVNKYDPVSIPSCSTEPLTAQPATVTTTTGSHGVPFRWDPDMFRERHGTGHTRCSHPDCRAAQQARDWQRPDPDWFLNGPPS